MNYDLELDHEMVEFRILRGGSRAISRIKTLELRRADFALFKELLGGILLLFLKLQGIPSPKISIWLYNLPFILHVPNWEFGTWSSSGSCVEEAGR